MLKGCSIITIGRALANLPGPGALTFRPINDGSQFVAVCDELRPLVIACKALLERSGRIHEDSIELILRHSRRKVL